MILLQKFLENLAPIMEEWETVNGYKASNFHQLLAYFLVGHGNLAIGID